MFQDRPRRRERIARTGSASIRPHRPSVALSTALIAFFWIGVPAQTPSDSHPPNPDAQIVTQPAIPPPTPIQLQTTAWKMLEDAMADGKHADLRVQGLAALGTLGSNPRSLKLIEQAMLDHDVDVRSAAVLAAGQTKSAAVTSDLRRMLDDKEPQVAFAAALTLWNLHDRSGEDILLAVAEGERPSSPGVIDNAEHSVNRDLHHPGTLARFGAIEGAGMLLGPFGIGISAYEYLHRNGGDAARASAIDALAQNHTGPIRAELISAVNDKDPGVRASAAKALADYHDRASAAAIATLFADSKPPVRLTAASAYLLNTRTATVTQAGSAQRSHHPVK